MIPAGAESTVTTWAQLSDALKAGGEITLQNNVTAPAGADALSVPKGKVVTLDLNGYTVDRDLDSAQKKGCVIEVLGDLTVTDMSDAQTGAITGGYTDGTGGGIWVRSTGSFTLEGGTITGNNAKNVGGGVYLSGSDSGFFMYGGTITGNSAKNGGGLGMDGSGFAELSGGTISNNVASTNGGGVWFGKGTSFSLCGGSIAGNTAAQGSGIYINDGTFEYNGGTVANNQQAVGGDIAAKSGAYLPKFPVTVNDSEDGTVTADKETAAEGETVVLTVEPDNDDIRLKSLTVTAGGTEIPTTLQANGTYTFAMPAAAVTVSAQFRELHLIYTDVLLHNDPYTDHDCTLTADKYDAIEGETVTLTLDLKPGYVFMQGDVNIYIPLTQVDDTTFTFVMPDCDADAVIYIEKAEYTVSLGGEENSGVTFLLGSEPKDFAPFPAEYGDWITVLFYPEDRMITAMTYTYTENGKTVTKTLSFYENGYYVEGSFRMPNADVTVRVEYSEVYNVVEDWEQVENGTISAEAAKASAGSAVTVYAVPDQRYRFSGWHFTPDVTLTSDATGADGTRIATFIMPEEDVSFYAAFEQAIYDVTARLPDGHGMITGDDWGRAGENYSFTVTPDSGYMIDTVSVFAGGEEIEWTNDGGVYTFTMPAADVTLRAQFCVEDTWADLIQALKNGGEIVLKRNYTASASDETLEVPEGVCAVLDLNGYTVNGDALTADDVLLVTGEMTLADSVGTGKLTGRDCEDVVYVNRGSFTLTGGKIEGVDPYFGSIYIASDSTCRISGGEVLGSGDRTVICSVVDNAGDLIVDDGLISGSGCICTVYNCGSVRLNGGTVYGEAKNVVYSEGGAVIVTGGSIEGLVGDEYWYGYGVYLDGSDLFLSGEANIDVAQNQFEGDPECPYDRNDFDIFLIYDAMIYVTGALDPDGPQIGVTMQQPGVFAVGASSNLGEAPYTLTECDAGRFKSKDADYGIRLTNDKKLEMAEQYTVTVSDAIENGTVTVDKASAFEGETITLTVNPDTNCELSTLTVTDASGETVSVTNGTFTMPASSVTVNAVFEQTAPNDKMSVSVDDQIALNIFLDLDFRGKTVSDVTILLNDQTYAADGVKMTYGDYKGLYKFKVVTAPAQIADAIVVKIGSGEDEETIPTSVKTYCTLLQDEQYTADYADAQTLARAMLAYGQAANDVFGYSGDAIADLSGLNVDDALNAPTVLSKTMALQVTGASFMALTKPEFRFYVTGIDEQTAYDYNQAGITVTMDGAKPDQDLNARFVRKASGDILLEVTGVSVENMDKTITVTINGMPEGQNTITFNGNVFAKAMASDTDLATRNLGAALYNYGAAAKTCFGA